ncbi:MULTISPECIES: 2-hydroxychromene-2-carboxylate isomerase [unclassified Pseudovibrio]|uniref:2-hydroxychromene-2-carboxylate isomerase n=1 Tax=unclassified Pseudovibrio TaxID=2627060 RepID=UPI0007AEAE1A|nr:MULTISPECIES: 2-hydroxychromene-2-carboxylate isomerase [unclassified Pseudovibrio]KZL19751.1 2-hydroxychromene-2-carboxylate isomerase [Pseudovibrio sp. WM33]KZL26908.1 2-hydroxychromene-2-carboxylate isomerase [Pseudovibrio sp. Ad37]
MTAQIDYFYTHLSPWAYLGHQEFLRIAENYDVTVTFRPVNLAVLFPLTGGLPLGKRHPARQKYRFIELQRWAEKRGVSMNYKPAYFPTDIALADSIAIRLQEQGGPVGTYSQKVFEAVWQKDLNAADENVLTAILNELGLDADNLIAAGKSDEMLEAYTVNSRMAETANAVGSPTYLLNSEPFWGQDRLDLLEDALKSGRSPYQSLE